MADIQETLQARQSIYGEPVVHFTRTVGILNAMGFRRIRGDSSLTRLSNLDWPQIMIADKLARSMEDPTFLDNAHDISGYAECWQLILKGEKVDG